MKRSTRSILLFLIFCALLAEIYIHTSYIFRNTDGPRRTVMSFFDEKKDSLDVVLVGGSNVYCYFDTMQFWKEKGVAAYNLTVSGGAAPTYLSVIREIERHQSSALIVVDVRKFLSTFWDRSFNSGNVRYYLDSFDIGFRRLLAVEEFRAINDLKMTDSLDAYFEIIYYHNNYDQLKNPVAWQFYNNRMNGAKNSARKGFYADEMSTNIMSFDRGSVVCSENTTPLLRESEQYYRKMLEYCKNNHIKLLLTASPFFGSETDFAQINEALEIAKEYGFPTLNGNDDFDLIGLNSEIDFMDQNHVNINGAKKWTKFFSEYLCSMYDFPDHQSEKEYTTYWEEYNDDYLPRMQELEQLMQKNIREHKN